MTDPDTGRVSHGETHLRAGAPTRRTDHPTRPESGVSGVETTHGITSRVKRGGLRHRDPYYPTLQGPVPRDIWTGRDRGRPGPGVRTRLPPVGTPSGVSTVPFTGPASRHIPPGGFGRDPGPSSLPPSDVSCRRTFVPPPLFRPPSTPTLAPPSTPQYVPTLTLFLPLTRLPSGRTPLLTWSEGRIRTTSELRLRLEKKELKTRKETLNLRWIKGLPKPRGHDVPNPTTLPHPDGP